jgi:hypothetical protein
VNVRVSGCRAWPSIGDRSSEMQVQVNVPGAAVLVRLELKAVSAKRSASL